MADTNTPGDSKRPRLSLRLKNDSEGEATQPAETAPVNGQAEPARAKLSLRKDATTDEGAEAAPAGNGAAEAKAPTEPRKSAAKPRLNLKADTAAKKEPPPQAATPPAPPPLPEVSPKAKAAVDAPPPVRVAKETPGTPPPLPKAVTSAPPSPPGAVPAPKPIKPKRAAPEVVESPAPQDGEGVETAAGRGPIFTLLVFLVLIGALGGGVYFLATSGFLGSKFGGDETADIQATTVEAPTAANGVTGAQGQSGSEAKPGGIFDRVNAVTENVAENVALYNEITIDEPSAPAAQAPKPQAAPAAQPPRPAPTATAAPTAPAAPAASARVEAFLANLNVSMVRTSSDGARIMVDNVIYHEGNLLDPDTGLTLTGADAQRKQLIFTDARGIVYRKEY